MAKDIFSKETWLLGLKLVLAQRVVTFPLEQRGFSCVDQKGCGLVLAGFPPLPIKCLRAGFFSDALGSLDNS